MADINIPGAELEEVSRSLGFVLDHIDTTASGIDIDQAVGYPLAHPAEHFERRWRDGRAQLHRQCSDVKKAIDQILEQFGKTDDQAASNLGDH